MRRKMIRLLPWVFVIAISGCSPDDEVLPNSEAVTTFRDANGWRLRVGSRDHFIKGIVWSYTPRGETHSYDLWSQSDEFVESVLDYEFGLMKSAGINTVRSFSMMPPRWVTYVYRKFGIMSVVNPMMGRYGYEIDGVQIENTDYSDPLTRKLLQEDMLEIVRKYQDTPGVLMFVFGNESNYGLSWSSFEIEDLPKGEQELEKARFLYSLFNDVISAAKKLNQDHPYTIVNGDLQYIDLIAELCPELDLLGVNVYRGPGFTSMWEDVERKLDLPIALFEFGSDSYDALRMRENQAAQARILKSQWYEIYVQSWGNSGHGNSVGGFVFEWRDEWWKYLQDKNLEVQDTTASWANDAYDFDWSDGNNNMNEEWFGIVSMGPLNDEGVTTAQPRLAYDAMKEILRIDPYTEDQQLVDLFDRIRVEQGER